MTAQHEDPGGTAGPEPREPAGTEQPGGRELDKEARLWATFAHLSALAGYLMGLMFLGPLIIWLIKREEMPFVDQQGKEAVNFNITVLIAYIALGVVTCGVGVVLFIPLAICHIVFVVIASIQVNGGEAYRYPVTLRFIK